MPTTEWSQGSVEELLKTGQLVAGQIVTLSKSKHALSMVPQPGATLLDTFLEARPAPGNYLQEFVFIRHENARKNSMVFILGLSPEHGTVIFYIPGGTQVAVRKL